VVMFQWSQSVEGGKKVQRDADIVGWRELRFGCGNRCSAGSCEMWGSEGDGQNFEVG
jgi:hypothetical protein